MKIGYIVVGEDITSPLLQRQVVELLIEIKKSNPDVEIAIFNFQSFFSILNHYKDLRSLSSILRIKKIRHFVIPNICPWPIPSLKFKKLAVGWRPYTVWNRLAAKVFSVAALPFFFVFQKIMGCNIFHCRSYPATLAAIKYKGLFHHTKVIFDPRSDFPEEGVTAGYWMENGKDFNYWKSTEIDLLEKSNATALIGPTYLSHYNNSTSNFKYFLVPNNVDVNFFKRDLIARERIRRDLEIPDDALVFVYLGALTQDGWHRTEFYKKFYDKVIKKNKKYSLLLLIPEHNARSVKDIFFDSPRVRILSPDYNQVSKYLSVADIGLMFFHKRKIAVGTKIGEYLCCDIPVIVNGNCLGAVDLIEQNRDFGCVIGLGLGDDDANVFIDEFKISELKNYRPSQKSTAYFDIKSIASRYKSQYDEIAEQ